MARAGFSSVRVWRSHGLLSLSISSFLYTSRYGSSYSPFLSSSPSSSSSFSVSLPLLFSVPFSLVFCASASVPLKHGFRKHQGICGVQTSLINHNLIIIVYVFLVVGGHGLVSRGCESGDPMAFSLPLSLLIYISLCSSSSLLFLFRSGAG